MPKKLAFLLTLSFLVSHLFFAAPAYASTDPQNATASATATVPSLTVSNDHDAPTVPILVRPVDGSFTNDPHPEFVWQGSSDTGSNTLYYTLYLNGTATYLGISNLGNSSGNNYTARLDQNELKLIPTLALPDGHYSWYVTATDLAGNTSRSTSWGLTIDTHAPPLTLTQLDIYPHPTIVEGANFDIAGPKDVYFTLVSDPHVHLQITLTDEAGHPLVLTGLTNSSGFATLYQHLELGTYAATILAFDQTGNTTLLPDFTITIIQATITLPGGPTLPLPPLVHDLPSALTHLPATIAQLDTRVNIATLLFVLLAIIVGILLILLWRRRYNIVFVNSRLQPLPHAVIYHSLPPHRSTMYQLVPHHRGRLYLPHLTRYSTLTVRVIDHDACTTHILSISAPARTYTIVL